MQKQQPMPVRESCPGIHLAGPTTWRRDQLDAGNLGSELDRAVSTSAIDDDHLPLRALLEHPRQGRRQRLFLVKRRDDEGNHAPSAATNQRGSAASKRRI